MTEVTPGMSLTVAAAPPGIPPPATVLMFCAAAGASRARQRTTIRPMLLDSEEKGVRLTAAERTRVTTARSWLLKNIVASEGFQTRFLGTSLKLDFEDYFNVRYRKLLSGCVPQTKKSTANSCRNPRPAQASGFAD